jgi:rhamnosyltransferase
VISVVIPVKDGGTDLVRCLAGISAQELGEEIEVVVVDSGSTDGSAERARASGAIVHEIAPEEFGHGRTRNLGVELARGETVVFTSQDAVAVGTGWLALLVAAARAGDDVAGAYGRQLPHPDARPPERFFLSSRPGWAGPPRPSSDHRQRWDSTT